MVLKSQEEITKVTNIWLYHCEGHWPNDWTLAIKFHGICVGICVQREKKHNFKVVDIFHGLSLSLLWQVLKMVKGVWFTIHFVMCFYFRKASFYLWPLFLFFFFFFLELNLRCILLFLFGWFSLLPICYGDLFWVHLKEKKGLTIRSKGTTKNEKNWVYLNWDSWMQIFKIQRW